MPRRLALARYAALIENFGPVVRPHNGLGARSAPKNIENQPRAVRRDIKGQPLAGFPIVGAR